MKAIIAKKIGQTQIFDNEGRRVPVTILLAGPCVVSEIRTKEKNGYDAMQLAFMEVKEHKLIKPIKGQLKTYNLVPYKYLKEIRAQNIDLKIGDKITVSLFKTRDYVDVSGVNKGKGFAGVIKRHHFKGGPASHGSMIHRKPMSAGDTNPARVLKGRGNPGQMGNANVTVQNLKVVEIDKENNLLLVKGAVPGANNSVVVVKSAKKKED